MNIKTFQPVYGLFSFRKTCNEEKKRKIKNRCRQQHIDVDWDIRDIGLGKDR